MQVESRTIADRASRTPTRTIRVLIIEDHEVVAEGIRSLIELESDLEVVGIATGVREAGRLGRETHPDVVLADFRLTDGNGAEAVAAMRKAMPRVRVLFLSAVDSPAALMAAIQAGARGYLLKSRAATDVVSAVRRVAEGEMLISASAVAALITTKGEQTHLLDTLTGREREVLRLLAQGLDNRALATHLNVRYGTARSHVRNLLAKLEVHTRMQAIVRAAQLGLLDPESAGLSHLD